MRNTFDVCFDMTSMCGTNYYKDFYSLGIRLIFLNSLNGGTFGYSEDTCAWFEEACAVSGEQRAGGEYYNHYHEYTRTDGVKGKLGMRFGFQRSTATSGQNYSHVGGCLMFGETSGDGTGGTYGMISVPGIPGRYVKSIEITHNKNAAFTLADGERFVYGASPNATSSASAGPTVFNLPYVKGEKTVPAQLGAPYNIRMRTAGTGVSKIKVTYSADAI